MHTSTSQPECFIRTAELVCHGTCINPHHPPSLVPSSSSTTPHAMGTAPVLQETDGSETKPLEATDANAKSEAEGSITETMLANLHGNSNNQAEGRKEMRHPPVSPGNGSLVEASSRASKVHTALSHRVIPQAWSSVKCRSTFSAFTRNSARSVWHQS